MPPVALLAELHEYTGEDGAAAREEQKDPAPVISTGRDRNVPIVSRAKRGKSWIQGEFRHTILGTENIFQSVSLPSHQNSAERISRSTRSRHLYTGFVCPEERVLPGPCHSDEMYGSRASPADSSRTSGYILHPTNLIWHLGYIVLSMYS